MHWFAQKHTEAGRRPAKRQKKVWSKAVQQGTEHTAVANTEQMKSMVQNMGQKMVQSKILRLVEKKVLCQSQSKT